MSVEKLKEALQKRGMKSFTYRDFHVVDKDGRWKEIGQMTDEEAASVVKALDMQDRGLLQYAYPRGFREHWHNVKARVQLFFLRLIGKV